MATATFSGPLLVGTIPVTTGTTLGASVKNTGNVVLAQSANITQASGATTIVIPANSQILEITVFVTTVWDGAAATFGVGTTALATKFTAAAAANGGAVGIVSITPSTDATRTAAFIDVGTADAKIVVTSANTGAGVGVITVRYVQNLNLR